MPPIISKIKHLLTILIICWLCLLTSQPRGVSAAFCTTGEMCAPSNGGETIIECRYKTTTPGSGYCTVVSTWHYTCTCYDSTTCECKLPGGTYCKQLLTKPELGTFICSGGPNALEPCWSNEECGAGYYCKAGSAYCIGGPNYGKPCTSNEYCQAGDIYSSAFCDIRWIDPSTICKYDGDPYVSCCMHDPNYTPTPTGTTPTDAPRNLTVSGNIYLASDPTFSSNQCTSTEQSAFTSSTTVVINYQGTNYNTTTTTGTYSILLPDVTTGQTFTITTSTSDSNYECSCPSDGASSCVYYDLTVPAVGTNTVNRDIYFDNITYADSWFQSFGAGAFAQGQLSSIVPTNTCLSPSCQAGVFVSQPGSNNVLTSGFPLTSGSASNILTGNVDDPFANIHLTGQRTVNADSFVTNVNTNLLGYNYFWQLAVDSGLSIRQVAADQVNLSTWRSSGWLPAGQTNFFSVSTANLVINETNQFQAANNETVVVFVDGNLILDDQGANGDKVTSVSQKNASNAGGFLAFIVNGDIYIRSGVGEILTPATPNVPAVTLANANLEGVFIADQTLQINSYADDGLIGAYPDRKLIVAGTLVGLDGVNLHRQVDDPDSTADDSYRVLNSNQALENFIYRPDLLLNWPDELKASIINWRELAPRSFEGS